MNTFLKGFLFLLLFFSTGSALPNTYNIKTIGEEFTPDTVYANVGDSIKFIIGIGHDVLEITDSAYVNNTIVAYPGGFNYPVGTFYFVVDSAKIYYYTCTYHMASSQMKGVIIADGSNSIGEIIKNNFPLIFPNPTTNHLYFYDQPDKNFPIKIKDVNGRIVLILPDLYGYIDVSGLMSGIYFVEISVNNRKKVVKFIKH